jgi:hypothetical protein
LLTLISLPHNVEYFIVLLGAVVWLVVVIADSLVLSCLLTGPLSLLVDEVLVNQIVGLSVGLSFRILSLIESNVAVELCFFILTLLFELEKILLVTVKGSKGSLICNSLRLIVCGMPIP